jgi:ATP-binding cassette subfamily B protein
VSQNSATISLLRRLFGLFRPYWHLSLQALLAIFAIDLFDVASPKVLERLIDQAIPQRDILLLTLLAFLLFAIPVLSGIVGIAKSYLDVALSQHMMHDLRVGIYDRLQQVSLRFYTSQRTGEIISRLTNDINGVEDIVKNTISQMVSNIIKIALVLVLMFSMSIPLTLLCLVLVPFFLFLSRSVGSSFRTTSALRQELLAEVSAHLEQTLTISGALLIKSFGRQQDERTHLTHASKQLVRVQIRQTMRGRWFMLMLHLFFSAVPACIYYLGGRQVIGGTVQLGQLVAFIALQAILFPAFRSLLDIHVSLQTALALFERLFAYLDLPLEINEESGAVELSEVQGHIRFRHVSFSYHPGRPVLCDIDVEIQPGQLVALVGPSGAGKTTTTYLLPRLYDVEEGAVEIDGHDVRSLALASLAHHIGIVPQETYLLHTTVRENILYGHPEATEEEMVTAAQAACIHERILELPQGYDTVVGPRGYLLSGGEKQRIAIARVLLKNPRILILDEATSSLDTHAERLIQTALARLQRSRTTIAIAHRLSTVLAADQILVLDQGRIVERGTHTDLISLGGLYAYLYKEQFDKQSSK